MMRKTTPRPPRKYWYPSLGEAAKRGGRVVVSDARRRGDREGDEERKESQGCQALARGIRGRRRWWRWIVVCAARSIGRRRRFLWTSRRNRASVGAELARTTSRAMNDSAVGSIAGTAAIGTAIEVIATSCRPGRYERDAVEFGDRESREEQGPSRADMSSNWGSDRRAPPRGRSIRRQTRWVR